MSNIDLEAQKLCDSLVYRYLLENRHDKTAKLLKEERKNSYTLKFKREKNISETLSSIISKYLRLELDTISNTLVYDYLKRHNNQRVQKLASKLNAKVPIEIKDDNPLIEEVLDRNIVSRHILVPLRKKPLNQPSSQAKGQNQSVKKIFDIAQKSKEVSVPTKIVDNYSVDSEKVMQIKEVFKSLKKSEIKIKGKTEVFTALKYILRCDIKVMKAQADSVNMKLNVEDDGTVRISPENSEQLQKMKVNLGEFSRGDKNSEESKMIKAWNFLVEKAQIIGKKQLILDFDNLVTEQWPCNVIGMYVSENLQEPRHALKVYEMLSKSVKNIVDPGEKIVPIKEVFKNKLDGIEIFKEDKPEVYKALKYILNSDTKIMVAQARSLEIICDVNKDTVNFRSNVSDKLKDLNVKLGHFSHTLSGENSEESRIVKAWYDLIEEAQIIDTKQLIQDFDNLLTVQWPCNMVGCYLSKYLEVPRHTLKVFELLTRSVLYNSGNFQTEEDELITQHMESKNGNYDLEYLKAHLKRPRFVIFHRIEKYLKHPEFIKRQKFTLNEDMMILQHVLGTKIPKEANGIINIFNAKKSWKDLEPKLNRLVESISFRWSNYIYPTILAYLSGTMNLQWKKDFFQFIIDNKFVSVTDIDQNIAKEKWPSIPFNKLTKTAKGFSQHGNNGIPLYQNIAKNLHIMREKMKVPQAKLDLIDAFEKVRNED